MIAPAFLFYNYSTIADIVTVLKILIVEPKHFTRLI